MALVSNLIVNTFNSVTGVFSGAYTYVPERVKNGFPHLSHLFKNIAPGPQKTFWTKPVVFLGDVIRFCRLDLNQHPYLAKISKLSNHAAVARSFTSCVEVFSYLPGALEALSTPVQDSKPIRQYVHIKDNSLPNVPPVCDMMDGPRISGVEMVAKRMFSVALLLTSLGDTVNEIKRVVERKGTPSAFPPLVSRVVPWIQTGAGLFMGVWGLYEEGKFASETWRKAGNTVHPAEKNYSIASMAMSASFLAYSILGGVGLYLGDRVPNGFGKAKLIVAASTIVIPVVAHWMRDNVTELHKQTKGQTQAVEMNALKEELKRLRTLGSGI